MRHILTAAAAIAVSGLLLSTAAVAQYQAGGPTQANGQCKVVTDSDADAYGYMAPCAPSAHAAAAPGSSAYARAPGGNYEAGGPSSGRRHVQNCHRR